MYFFNDFFNDFSPYSGGPVPQCPVPQCRARTPGCGHGLVRVPCCMPHPPLAPAGRHTSVAVCCKMNGQRHAGPCMMHRACLHGRPTWLSHGAPRPTPSPLGPPGPGPKGCLQAPGHTQRAYGILSTWQGCHFCKTEFTWGGNKKALLSRCCTGLWHLATCSTA
jgi:hypothetical protein